jgi:hypothetical protein
VDDIGEPVLVAVFRASYRRRNPPDDQLHERRRGQLMALSEQKLGIHGSSCPESGVLSTTPTVSALMDPATTVA